MPEKIERQNLRTKREEDNLEFDYSRYDFKMPEIYEFKTKKGLDEQVIKQMSYIKGEPEWMLNFRLKAYEIFKKKPLPTWGPDLSEINFDEYYYYIKPTDKKGHSWDEVPDYIKETFERLGIPEAERKFLAGVGAMYESEVVYHKIREDLAKKGVIFVDTDTAVKEYPDLVKEYFGKVIPPTDNKFAALNSAVWSGGCLTKDTMVFTANPGIKPISQIESGDIVYALSEDKKIVPARVIAKIYNGKKPVYRIRVGGRTIEATGNHMFLTLQKSDTKLNSRGKRWYKVWKKLEDIKEGELIAIAKKIPDSGKPYKLPPLPKYIKNNHLQKHLKAPVETNEDLMWLLGVLMGDGNIYWPNDHMCFINFALPENDPVRKEAIRVIKKLFNYRVKTSNKVSFTVNSKALGKWLEDLGFGGKAKTKTIPNWVFGLPIKQKLAFLGGLLDADGYIDYNAGAVIRFELSNKQLIEQIKLLAISCGLYSDGKILARKKQSVLKKEKRKIYSGKFFSCRITGNVKLIASRNVKIKKMLNYSKSTFDKYNSTTGNNFVYETSEWLGFAPLKEKVLVGEKDVYDIQVENYANFIANGIIAHNSFIYVPPGVKVDLPLQAYFRINAQNVGQFERTLIIADERSEVVYVEGCSAPVYSKDSLHSAVVEIIAKPGSRVQYITIQNWSKNVYNLVTKRAVAYEDAEVIWIDGNIGSHVTMKYPAIYLMGKGARGQIISVAYAGKNQIQDTGAKVIHAAPHTKSVITSKSVSKFGGTTTYRGLVKVAQGAHNSTVSVTCDALILDEISKSNTIPTMEILEDDVTISHEASVGRISEDVIFYLSSRGLKESEALAMIVRGFMEPFVKSLPMEYAVEMNRLLELEMEGAVG